ncbi:MAG: hypothetical protein B7Y29_05555, partial [Thiotrichales bacterium 16-46-22]
MLFDETIIEQIKEDPINGLANLLAIVDTSLTKDVSGKSFRLTDKNHETITEFILLLSVLNEGKFLHFELSIPNLTHIKEHDIQAGMVLLYTIRQQLQTETKKRNAESIKEKYSNILGTSFYYEFSPTDLTRLQELINELRDLIASTNDLESDHQRRLLSRLEKLQSELHKKLSDVDRFWGLVGDAGVMLEKLGKNAKPMVDRIKEIAQITWKTQTQAEGLPNHS